MSYRIYPVIGGGSESYLVSLRYCLWHDRAFICARGWMDKALDSSSYFVAMDIDRLQYGRRVLLFEHIERCNIDWFNYIIVFFADPYYGYLNKKYR